MFTFVRILLCFWRVPAGLVSRLNFKARVRESDSLNELNCYRCMCAELNTAMIVHVQGRIFNDHDITRFSANVRVCNAMWLKETVCRRRIAPLETVAESDRSRRAVKCVVQAEVEMWCAMCVLTWVVFFAFPLLSRAAFWTPHIDDQNCDTYEARTSWHPR